MEYSKLPEHGCFWRISSCEHFRVLSDLPAQGSLESHDKASTLAVKKVADINIRYTESAYNLMTSVTGEACQTSDFFANLSKSSVLDLCWKSHAL
ncbi:hypothetical protein M8J77_009806 [Diaphorina citri]|nr:hypothetical protein M8J77_009806 [Diaphorina citri]